jgi:hypothetical protein
VQPLRHIPVATAGAGALIATTAELAAAYVCINLLKLPLLFYDEYLYFIFFLVSFIITIFAMAAAH